MNHGFVLNDGMQAIRSSFFPVNAVVVRDDPRIHRLPENGSSLDGYQHSMGSSPPPSQRIVRSTSQQPAAGQQRRFVEAVTTGKQTRSRLPRYLLPTDASNRRLQGASHQESTPSREQLHTSDLSPSSFAAAVATTGTELRPRGKFSAHSQQQRSLLQRSHSAAPSLEITSLSSPPPVVATRVRRKVAASEYASLKDLFAHEKCLRKNILDAEEEDLITQSESFAVLIAQLLFVEERRHEDEEVKLGTVDNDVPVVTPGGLGEEDEAAVSGDSDEEEARIILEFARSQRRRELQCHTTSVTDTQQQHISTDVQLTEVSGRRTTSLNKEQIVGTDDASIATQDSTVSLNRQAVERNEEEEVSDDRRPEEGTGAADPHAIAKYSVHREESRAAKAEGTLAGSGIPHELQRYLEALQFQNAVLQGQLGEVLASHKGVIETLALAQSEIAQLRQDVAASSTSLGAKSDRTSSTVAGVPVVAPPPVHPFFASRAASQDAAQNSEEEVPHGGIITRGLYSMFMLTTSCCSRRASSTEQLGPIVPAVVHHVSQPVLDRQPLPHEEENKSQLQSAAQSNHETSGVADPPRAACDI